MVSLAQRLGGGLPRRWTNRATCTAEDLLSLAACHLRSGDTLRAERLRRAAATADHDDTGGRFTRWAACSNGRNAGRRQPRCGSFGSVRCRAPASPFAGFTSNCEWRTGDLEQAEMWAAWALHTVEAAPVYQQAGQGRSSAPAGARSGASEQGGK